MTMPSKRALIVDDSTTAQYRLKKMLRAYDLDIDTADSGESALRYLATNAPAVIFMDHLMPGMDGFRALQIIKSHPETAMIPVIMYTSKSGDVYTGQARALGALDVVSKDTINAADLSKVMEAIHIYQKNADVPKSPQEHENIETKDFIAAANKVSELNEISANTAPEEPQIERRALNRASMEQARNLELRMSHLEHTLEDSRRFITSRVVRELHGLRENLKQELSTALIHQQPAAPTPPPTTEPPEAPRSQRWPTVSIVLILILLGVMATYLMQMIDMLKQSSNEQALLSEQVQLLDEKQAAALNAANKPSTTIEPTNIINTNNYADDNVLADLSWAFNQSGELSFHQNSIDPKTLVNLHEFLRRLIGRGYTGKALVTIFIGNFCTVIDNYGVAQLPPSTSTLGGCMLSSEIYGLERVATQYQEDVETALYSLRHNQQNAIDISIETRINTDAYPERLPTINTKEWNEIAQANNRLEITLEANPLP